MAIKRRLRKLEQAVAAWPDRVSEMTLEERQREVTDLVAGVLTRARVPFDHAALAAEIEHIFSDPKLLWEAQLLIYRERLKRLEAREAELDSREREELRRLRNCPVALMMDRPSQEQHGRPASTGPPGAR
jgi:hypothetical protein